MLLDQLHDSPEATKLAPGFSECVGIARFGKIKFPETGLGAELAVLRALKRRGTSCFGESMGVKRCYTIRVRIMESDPLCLKDFAIGMQVTDILGQNIRISLTGMVRIWWVWMCQGEDLQG